ncbi:MAG TPA: gamma-glutamylcyclotransferase family protein [Kiloniellales bacterium]|nr:gamma-glutamylcyclotransferase family protein [Kiloniellales bacterium]
MDHRVWVYFYGSYINLEVLKEVELVPGAYEVATLPGFDIRIAPRANLVRDPQSVVYGILATARHAELDRLYRDHAKGVLGEDYLPEAVIAYDTGGRLRPALCYIAPAMTERPAESAYVERIAKPAETYGFPADYVAKLRSFAPGTSDT